MSNEIKYVLSKEDVLLLRRMADEYRKRDPRLYINPNEVHQWRASDIYVAKVVETIPARVQDTVSWKVCDIYRIQTPSGGGTAVLSSMGMQKTVFNLTEEDVAADADQYYPVVLTKNGKWVILTGAGGGGTTYFKHLCRFTLMGDLTVAMESQWAIMTHEYGEGTTHIGRDSGDTGTATGTTGTDIIVHNFETHEAGTYEFYGDSGDAGLAYYDRWENGVEHWIIVFLECP